MLVADYLYEVEDEQDVADFIQNALRTEKDWEYLYAILSIVEEKIRSRAWNADTILSLLGGKNGIFKMAGFQKFKVSDKLWGDNWRIREIIARILLACWDYEDYLI